MTVLYSTETKYLIHNLIWTGNEIPEDKTPTISTDHCYSASQNSGDENTGDEIGGEKLVRDENAPHEMAGDENGEDENGSHLNLLNLCVVTGTRMVVELDVLAEGLLQCRKCFIPLLLHKTIRVVPAGLRYVNYS